MVRAAIPAMFLVLGGEHSLFLSLSIILAVRFFFYMLFIKLKFHFIFSSLRVFIMIGYLIGPNDFFGSLK